MIRILVLILLLAMPHEAWCLDSMRVDGVGNILRLVLADDNKYYKDGRAFDIDTIEWGNINGVYVLDGEIRDSKKQRMAFDKVEKSCIKMDKWLLWNVVSSSRQIDEAVAYVRVRPREIFNKGAQQVDSAEASTIAVPPSVPSGSPR